VTCDENGNSGFDRFKGSILYVKNMHISSSKMVGWRRDYRSE
jgi:hypothetical protein